jgi:hypothetical protein
VSEPWEDEGFGAENDWVGESVEKDLEEDGLFEPVDVDEDDDDDLDSEDEQ